jgi:protein-L-isoaspartate(D-aspartate) O-methyltransferase
MVAGQLERRGIRDRKVLEAMAAIPREAFVPGVPTSVAYDDRALPIDAGQTISQPYMVARMTELLEVEPGDRILEVGTGSGYQAAVLGGSGRVTHRRHHELSEEARSGSPRSGRERRPAVGDGTWASPRAPWDGMS